MDDVWIGTSGWSYNHWKGVLYPPGLPSGERLDVYARSFDTVELNGSFYHWPREATLSGWAQRLPDGFRMTVKAARGLSHARRLSHPEEWIERIRVGMHALGEHRGALLVQTHPAHERDDERLSDFLTQLNEACPWLQVAVELRHPSWHCEPVRGILADHGAAYVIMSGAHLPCLLWVTAPFAYVRWHGPHEHALYSGSYSEEDLRWWAERIREWREQGVEVMGYFNNDGFGYAVRNALTLKVLLDLP